MATQFDQLWLEFNNGNPPPLFSDYKSPAASDLDASTDISLWIIQRDERLGVQWYESCLRVAP